MHRKSIDHELSYKKPGRNTENNPALNPQNERPVIFMLIVNEEIRNYMRRLCAENKYDYYPASDPEKLVTVIKKLDSPVLFVDYEAVNTYGAGIYSRINATGTGCNVILLSDKDHKNLIKEAMELGAYACILAPYAEWEVLTMIRNILAKKKLRG